MLMAASLVLMTGCGGADGITGRAITVKGMVTVRGNEPFARPILETDGGNLYVLVNDRQEAPRHGAYRVTGSLFLDEWNGMPFTHLRVNHAEVLPTPDQRPRR